MVLWLAEPQAATLPSSPLLFGHRTDSWRWDVLTLDEAPAGSLDGVRGAQLNYSVFATIRGGGTLRWAGLAAPDWRTTRLQPWYTATSPSGETVSWPLGVFIPSAPKVRVEDALLTADVQLYDKLLILDRDKVEAAYAVPAGTVVTTEVASLITGAGEERYSIVASTETLTAPMVFDPGTTKLHIINELLSAINYFSLWVDGYGVYQADPYIPPGSRGEAFAFLDSSSGLYKPSFDHDRDDFDVPNKVVCVSRSDGENPVMSATATNEDPNSPYSYPSVGNHWFTEYVPDVEATSQTVLDAIAARKLAEAMQVTSTLTIAHPMLPLELNNRVRFRSTRAGLDVPCVLQAVTIEQGLGAVATSTIREVTL